jgi:hypothetical protein
LTMSPGGWLQRVAACPRDYSPRLKPGASQSTHGVGAHVSL